MKPNTRQNQSWTPVLFHSLIITNETILDKNENPCTRLGEPSKLKTGKTMEMFPTSNDPPPHLSWELCEVGN